MSIYFTYGLAEFLSGSHPKRDNAHAGIDRLHACRDACLQGRCAHQAGGDARALPKQALRRGRWSAGAGRAALLLRLLHGLHRRAALLRLRTPRIPRSRPRHEASTLCGGC